MKIRLKKKPLHISVISDTHLGTYGCHAYELYHYLKEIDPQILILNGDIIDIWQFKKNYWPKEHMLVLKEILNKAIQGTEVYYITGNHDELLRKFSNYQFGKIKFCNKLSLEIDNKKMLFFHGDVFDVSMQYTPWLSKLGAISYDWLIYINRFVNNILEKLGKNRISLSKNIKNSVKSAVAYINKFEDLCVEHAIKNGYDTLVCGHIHQPEIKIIERKEQKLTYLNSGDWIENLTALEYSHNKWHLFSYYDEIDNFEFIPKERLKKEDISTSDLFELLIKEFKTEEA